MTGINFVFIGFKIFDSLSFLVDFHLAFSLVLLLSNIKIPILELEYCNFSTSI